MTSVCVVMPYHGEARFDVASWVDLRYQSVHPGWKFVCASDGGEPWTKCRAVNRGVPADADVIVVTDADIAVPAAALEWAVDACSGFGAAWAVPFSTVYRLNQETTAWLLASGWDANITAMSPGQCVQHRPPYPAYPGGGLFVVARDAWETVGGFDERFVWGYEDQSLGWALDTLAGPHVQYDGPLVHLFHEQRRTSRAMYDDQRLQASYLAARGKPDAMRALVRERSTIERA